MSEDLFRNRLDEMIDLKHPLAVLAARLLWQRMQAALKPMFVHKACPLKVGRMQQDLLGEVSQISGGSVSNAGRPRHPLRLTMVLTLLKNSFDLSDEESVVRFSENVYYQDFAGYEYFDPRSLCDPTQIGRFRTSIGEAGLEALLGATIHSAIEMESIKTEEFKPSYRIGNGLAIVMDPMLFCVRPQVTGSLAHGVTLLRIARVAKVEGAEIHWGDQTALDNTDVRNGSFVAFGQAPVTMAVGGTGQRLSMISTVTDQGRANWMIIDEAFNHEQLIEFLQARIDDIRRIGKKVLPILDNLRTHHCKFGVPQRSLLKLQGACLA